MQASGTSDAWQSNAAPAVQELLSHPFLRPTAAPHDSLVGVSKDQLKKLLIQVRLLFITLPQPFPPLLQVDRRPNFMQPVNSW